MIPAFSPDTALLLIDVQRGVDVLTHWGGPNGRRNNPFAETAMQELLGRWRDAALPVMFTLHDSLEPESPLKVSEPGGQFKSGFEPRHGEDVITKHVNGAFFGTDLELRLRRRRIHRLVLVGFFTNMCVETTARTAGNLAFDTYVVSDACATTNRIGPDGTDHDSETVHQLSLASLHGEFCTTLSSQAATQLLTAIDPSHKRARGNQPRTRL